MDRGSNVDVREGLRQEKFEVYACMEAMGQKVWMENNSWRLIC